MIRPGQRPYDVDPGDVCNWLPMGLVDKASECGKPCVQEFKLRSIARELDCHRCTGHTLAPEFIERLRGAERR
jgi:hypothetical protein